MCPAAQDYMLHSKPDSDAGPFEDFADFIHELPAWHSCDMEFIIMLKRHPNLHHKHSTKVASLKRYFHHAAGSDTFTELSRSEAATCRFVRANIFRSFRCLCLGCGGGRGFFYEQHLFVPEAKADEWRNGHHIAIA